jgi:hypothetical protein
MPFFKTMNTYDTLLQRCCGLAALRRYDLSAPFIQQGHVWATNGYLIMSVPATACEQAYALDKDKRLNIAGVVRKYPEAVTPGTLPPLPAHQQRKLGRIRLVPACRSCTGRAPLVQDCPQCGGTGDHLPVQPVRWMGHEWEWAFLRVIFDAVQTVGNGRCNLALAPAPNEPGAALRLETGEAVFILLSRLPGYTRKRLPELPAWQPLDGDAGIPSPAGR